MYYVIMYYVMLRDLDGGVLRRQSILGWGSGVGGYHSGWRSRRLSQQGSSQDLGSGVLGFDGVWGFVAQTELASSLSRSRLLSLRLPAMQLPGC